MNSKVLTIIGALGVLGAGAAVFMNWESGTIDDVVTDTAHWNQVDRASCTAAACGTNACTAVTNILQDAGSACVTRRVQCDFRVSDRVRSCFSDAGLALSVSTYQRIELSAIRCPGIDGGFTFGTAFDDAGCPIDSPLVVTPRCVRAPLDGGTTCLRNDGTGARFFGTGNAFPAAQASGSNCEPVGCVVIAGDNPDTTL